MGFSVLYSVLDAKGQSSTMEVNVPSSVTFANIVLFASEVAKLIHPLMTGQITRIGVAFTVALPAGLRAAPLANSDVEEGARFQFGTSGGFYTATRIPTIDESIILPGTRQVNTANAAVAALVTALRDGLNLVPVGGTATVSASDSRGEDITSLASAVEMFQASRKRAVQ
jgi:hypothetical protein